MNHRAPALGLAGLLLAATAPAASAADRFPTLALGVDGSIPLSFADDTYRNPAGRSDYLTSPYLKLSAFGRLMSNLNYSLYASGGFDKYAARPTGDSTLASLGTGLGYRFGHFNFGGYFERNNSYDGIFGAFLYTSNDVGVYLRYNYIDAAKLWRVRPSVSASNRFADDPSATSYVFSFKADIERKLHDKWWIGLTPRVRFQNFTGGENAGRQDTLGSVSGSLRYSASDQLSLSLVVGYERRVSTQSNRDFNNLGVGASVDFSHSFDVRK